MIMVRILLVLLLRYATLFCKFEQLGLGFKGEEKRRVANMWEEGEQEDENKGKKDISRMGFIIKGKKVLSGLFCWRGITHTQSPLNTYAPPH